MHKKDFDFTFGMIRMEYTLLYPNRMDFYKDRIVAGNHLYSTRAN